jgi:rhamnosyl/mannosyltransferase
MPKVLHFFKTYYPDTFGGVEQVIYQLAEGCSEQGIESRVLTLSSEPDRGEPLVGRHRVDRAPLNFELASTGFSWSAIQRFRQLALEADLIHYHFPWPFMDLVHFLSGVNKPSLVTYHSDIVKQKHLLKLYSPLMHRFLGSVDRIVATSPDYVATSPVLARHRDKVRVVPLGIDEAGYPRPSPERVEYWRSRLGDGFFLFVGALRYYKGLEFLVRAARLNGLPVVIAGLGPMESRLRQLSGGEKQISLVGRVSDEDKVALLSLCRGLVFPSHLRSEAFGVSLLEAAMFSKPLISCEIGTGTSYVNRDGETGFIIPPENPMALAEAMRRLWTDDKAAMAMGAAARTRFEQLFTARQMCERYVALYRELL